MALTYRRSGSAVKSCDAAGPSASGGHTDRTTLAAQLAGRVLRKEGRAAVRPGTLSRPPAPEVVSLYAASVKSR